MNNITFPLSEDNQDKYYHHTAIDHKNGTTFDIFEIEGKFYDILGNEVNEDGTDKKIEEASEQDDRYYRDLQKYGLKEIDGIVAKFEELIKEYQIPMSDLVGTGSIYYMNGNDGTDFDWQANDRTCEFMMFYKSTELGFAKLSIRKDGSLDGYVWLEEGKGEAVEVHVDGYTEYPEEFAALLFEQADQLGKYDENIGLINWNAKVERTSYDWLYDYEDEEDDWYEEEEEDYDEDYE